MSHYKGKSSPQKAAEPFVLSCQSSYTSHPPTSPKVLVAPGPSWTQEAAKMVLHEYTYIFAIGTCFALLEAFNNGASTLLTPDQPGPSHVY